MGDAEDVERAFVRELRSEGMDPMEAARVARNLMRVVDHQDAAVVPQADVDTAARLRAAVERHMLVTCARDEQTLADQELWAAAAVGSETPEGEAVPVGIAVDTERNPVGLTVRTTARPPRCPTCGSDKRMTIEDACDGTWSSIDPWHSPDPDRGSA